MDSLRFEQAFTGEHLFYLAACRGNAELFKRVLENPENRICLKDTMAGHDGLSAAIFQGNDEIVKAFVSLPLSEFDFRHNPMESSGAFSYLNAAAVHERPVIFKILADTGHFDIAKRDARGWTPLFYAAVAGSPTIVEMLLREENIKTDEKDNEGRTPLSHAAEHGHKEIFHMFLRLDAVKPDSQDLKGNTPYYYAVRYGHGDIVQALIDTGRVNRDVEGKALEARQDDLKSGPRLQIHVEEVPF
ncbi:hypothetical protein NW762_013492 [Fusarium torreyae]|uniref:Ankyrin repeat protein n=1 Tax=Fusarium torreyae TaxID=1237075 RepID=A0A9W8RNE0_9HYPO|nr:hypothetical protein NW762_013492 [Fusarium torreyae]